MANLTSRMTKDLALFAKGNCHARDNIICHLERQIFHAYKSEVFVAKSKLKIMIIA